VRADIGGEPGHSPVDDEWLVDAWVLLMTRALL